MIINKVTVHANNLIYIFLKKVYAIGGTGSIVRVLSDRKRV